LSLV
jgi:condensin complex subunit 2